MTFSSKTELRQFRERPARCFFYTCIAPQRDCREQNIALQRRICCGGNGVCLEEYGGENDRRRSLETATGRAARPMDTGVHPARRLERRWAPRYEFRAAVEIEWGSAVLRASTRDISSNGMFIESPDTLWIGAGFTARIALDRPVKVDCFVKRVEPGRGMGVVVTVSEPQNQKQYQDLLASLSRTAT
jgi:hypothetical protein